jgi:hypothetical protein
MTGDKPRDQPEGEPPKKERPAFEVFIEQLKRDPAFRVHEPQPRGEGFILGGQNPAHPKSQG